MGSDRSLVADLSRPSAYPAPLPDAVIAVTTHASWVFLTNTEAWKLKRPVSYGFLDYSDAPRRRWSCEEEVRLGARLAPDVYRGVVPLFSGADGFSFVGPGTIVDAAVRMKRLPDDESALALVRAGRLGSRQLAALCELLAAFYEAAPSRHDFGGQPRLAAAIEENYQQTLPFADRCTGRPRLEHLHDAQARAAVSATDLLNQRVLAGRIRDGHGDLRLEHVYFLSDRGGVPVVIDPIEFNPAFRYQDTALDVAFLAMELEAAGRRDLSVFLCSRFARASGDYDFFPLADLYLGYRAWVRAKVACFVAAAPGTPADEAARKLAEATRLLTLAESYLRPRPRTRTLIAVGGMIAAGKSTVAEALGLALAAPVISSDDTRKSLAGLAPTARGGDALYDEAFTNRTYAEMLRRARPILESGRDVILDATFRRARHRHAARALAHAHDLGFLFVALDADDETLLRRLRARDDAPGVSDARADLLPWSRRHHEPPDELPPHERLAVDGREGTDALVAAIAARVDAPRGAP